MVLLVGEYSVGKSSFIKYMLDQDFPGIRIGPEPTTDEFSVVMHGQSERVVPGNAAIIDRSRPFQKLERFGMSFVSKFSIAELPSPIL